MRHSTISEKENPYMKRKEIVLKLDHAGSPTPSNLALQQHFAKEWKTAVEHVEIKKIRTLVGKQESIVNAYAWQEKKVADLSKPVEKPKEGAVPAALAAEAKK